MWRDKIIKCGEMWLKVAQCVGKKLFLKHLVQSGLISREYMNHNSLHEATFNDIWSISRINSLL